MASTLNFSLLDKVYKLCKGDKKKQNQVKESLSFTWMLFSKGSSLVIAIGFFMSFSENIFGKNMECYLGDNKEYFVSYAVNYCYIHGANYIEKDMHGKVSPCIVNKEKIDSSRGVTRYYIWMPYVLAFLFVIARLPYYIWRRFYSKLITSIFNGDEPKQLIFNFLYYSYKYSRISRMYSLLEAMNLILLIFSIAFTHFVFNREFIFYGYEMMLHFWSSESNTNPGCYLFPTEVSCNINFGSATGMVNQKNFLCLFTNNLFNQFFFLILWSYWGFILFIATIGIFFRIFRCSFPFVSKYICLYKIENPIQRKKLKEIRMSSCEWFMLEYLLHSKNPLRYDEIIQELCLQIKSYPSCLPLLEKE